MVTALFYSSPMTYATPITPTICINAPPAIADLILRRRLVLLKERCPELVLRLNPKTAVAQSAQIHLGFEDIGSGQVLCRYIGSMTSRTYLHQRNKTLHVLPNIIAGLDADYTLSETDQRPIVEQLYISIDKALFYVPGIRQTLDWIECSVSSLFWLNDETQT